MSFLDDYDIGAALRSENQLANEPTDIQNEIRDDRSDADVDALGVDEEINVRTRKPRAKLDEARLLSSKGLPALKNTVLNNVKFKGKGHELRDLDRLLEQYQIWAHQVFPRARFDDFIYIARSKGSLGQIRLWRKEQISKEIEQSRLPEERESIQTNNTTRTEQEQSTDPTILSDHSEEELHESVTRFPNSESLFVSDSDDDIYDASAQSHQPAVSKPDSVIQDDLEQEAIQAYEELGF